MYKVIAYYNVSEETIFVGDLKECKGFVEFYDGEYIDSNDFSWNLRIEKEKN